MDPVVYIIPDGSCYPNPGPGGWAALLIATNKKIDVSRFHRRVDDEAWPAKMISGGARETTNNRQELQAVIGGLKALTKRCEVHLYTDSQYVKNGITEWIDKWKLNGWRTAKKEPVKNQDLWESLDLLRQLHYVTFHWIKGHDDESESQISYWNALVDAVAGNERMKYSEGKDAAAADTGSE